MWGLSRIVPGTFFLILPKLTLEQPRKIVKCTAGACRALLQPPASQHGAKHDNRGKANAKRDSTGSSYTDYLGQDAKAASKRKREADDLGKSKRTKRDKQKSKNRESVASLRESSPIAETISQNGVHTESPLAETRVQELKQEQQKAKKPAKKQDASSWKLSQPMGGRMLDIDPILTSDDQYVCHLGCFETPCLT